MKLPAWVILAAGAASVIAATAAGAVPVGETCGGAVGTACDQGLWCEPPPGKCTVAAGVCVAVPRFCIARKRSASFKPVCGCNSRTYSSDCFRRAFKVAKDHDGKCETQSATPSGG